jgi:hypothetical protein
MRSLLKGWSEALLHACCVGRTEGLLLPGCVASKLHCVKADGGCIDGSWGVRILGS